MMTYMGAQGQVIGGDLTKEEMKALISIVNSEWFELEGGEVTMQGIVGQAFRQYCCKVKMIIIPGG